MRTLGVLAATVLLTACNASGGDTADPASQKQLGKEALKAARPGITAALAPTSHTFGGTYLTCRLGRNNHEYYISGGVIAPADTWKSGLQALSDELADSGWTLSPGADETVVTAKRDGVTLSVMRQLRTEDGVEWVVQITTPCVSYSEEDSDEVSTEGGIDDLSSDF
jgi:hypothetical protein